MQVMKREQSQLSHEAHECVEGIPELYKMVDGVQALGEFLKVYNQKVLKQSRCKAPPEMGFIEVFR